MLMGAFTEYLMAVMLAASLLFAPPAARAQSAEDARIVPCKFAAGSIEVRHDICVELVGVAFALNQSFAKRASREDLFFQCFRDLRRRLPGKTELQYDVACDELLRLMNF